MERLLVMIVIFGIPALSFAKRQSDASGNARHFTRSDEVIVVFTERGKIIGRMKTNVVVVRPNGDLKIYGEKFTGVGRNGRKYTLSGTLRRVDIAADGAAHIDDVRDLHISIRQLRKDEERIRRRWRRRKRCDRASR